MYLWLCILGMHHTAKLQGCDHNASTNYDVLRRTGSDCLRCARERMWYSVQRNSGVLGSYGGRKLHYYCCANYGATNNNYHFSASQGNDGVYNRDNGSTDHSATNYASPDCLL
jgi:hypothetical protein